MNAMMFYRPEFTVSPKRWRRFKNRVLDQDPGYYPPVRFVMCPECKMVVWVDDKAEAESLRDAHNEATHGTK